MWWFRNKLHNPNPGNAKWSSGICFTRIERKIYGYYVHRTQSALKFRFVCVEWWPSFQRSVYLFFGQDFFCQVSSCVRRTKLFHIITSQSDTSNLHLMISLSLVDGSTDDDKHRHWPDDGFWAQPSLPSFECHSDWHNRWISNSCAFNFQKQQSSHRKRRGKSFSFPRCWHRNWWKWLAVERLAQLTTCWDTCNFSCHVLNVQCQRDKYSVFSNKYIGWAQRQKYSTNFSFLPNIGKCLPTLVLWFTENKNRKKIENFQQKVRFEFSCASFHRRKKK